MENWLSGLDHLDVRTRMLHHITLNHVKYTHAMLVYFAAVLAFERGPLWSMLFLAFQS